MYVGVIKDHSCEGMIAFVGEWKEEVLSYEKPSGKSIPDRSMRSVSCGCELILCDYHMSMFMLWAGNVKGYIRKMKEV